MLQEQMFSSEIDYCKDHGIWLDKGELRAIVQRAGMKTARITQRAMAAHAATAEEQGKLKGIFLGWWSLFF
jgi:Zn-finger nucleic acid-binding protein